MVRRERSMGANTSTQTEWVIESHVASCGGSANRRRAGPVRRRAPKDATMCASIAGPSPP